MHLKKLRDLIGFTKQFINQAAVYLANRKDLPSSCRKRKLLKVERDQRKGNY